MALFKSLAGCYRMANHLVDEGAKGFGAAALKRGYTGVVNDRLERRPLDASTLRQPLKSETTALGAGQAKLTWRQFYPKRSTRCGAGVKTECRTSVGCTI